MPKYQGESEDRAANLKIKKKKEEGEKHRRVMERHWFVQARRLRRIAARQQVEQDARDEQDVKHNERMAAEKMKRIKQKKMNDRTTLFRKREQLRIDRKYNPSESK